MGRSDDRCTVGRHGYMDIKEIIEKNNKETNGKTVYHLIPKFGYEEIEILLENIILAQFNAKKQSSDN